MAVKNAGRKVVENVRFCKTPANRGAVRAWLEKNGYNHIRMWNDARRAAGQFVIAYKRVRGSGSIAQVPVIPARMFA